MSFGGIERPAGRHVKICLIHARRLERIGSCSQNPHDALRNLRVEFMVPGEEYSPGFSSPPCLFRKAPGSRDGHCGANAKTPRDIIRGGNDPPPRSLLRVRSDDQRQTPKLRIIPFLDRGEERIHINVDNDTHRCPSIPPLLMRKEPPRVKGGSQHAGTH